MDCYRVLVDNIIYGMLENTELSIYVRKQDISVKCDDQLIEWIS